MERDEAAQRSALAHVPPNWFAAVMGTGIIAVAAASLPARAAALSDVARLFWMLSAATLVLVAGATAAHWAAHPGRARAHLRNPQIAPFYGAVPMGMLTVGAATLTIGAPLIGSAAIALDWGLWIVGTVLGLACAFVIPYVMFVRLGVQRGEAFGGWLMPVVPPMVSAATGALLVPHTPPGAIRTGMLIACYVMFALALLGSALLIPMIVRRATVGAPLSLALVPTVWIVLGPVGQSITAANLLGRAAGTTLSGDQAAQLRAFGVVYGCLALAAAAVWGVAALGITVRAARAGLPFALSWWAFTFPVGTVVTGASALAAHVAHPQLTAAATGLWLVLLTAWGVVAVGTVRGVATGALLRPPAASPPAAGPPAAGPAAASPR